MEKTQKIPCPICKENQKFLKVNTGAERDPNGNITRENSWLVCGRCGFVHLNPRPSAEALNELYLNSAYHQSNASTKNLAEYIPFAHWYYDERIAYISKHSGLSKGSIFDIGFGHGGLLHLFKELGWKTFGVEPDKNHFEFAKKSFGLENVQNGILDANYQNPEKVDLVCSNHAFEHFADLDQVMQGIVKVIKPGGYLFTSVPTYAQNRTNQSREWMNPDHYSMFTHQSLNQLFGKYGFEPVSHTYRGWYKEVDDLWHLAKYTGKIENVKKYYENPPRVQRYVNVINPIRTFLLWPIFSHFGAKVRTYYQLKRLLIHYPREFFKRLIRGRR